MEIKGLSPRRGRKLSMSDPVIEHVYGLNALSYDRLTWEKFQKIWEQESPPAWTQEAYRPPCSEYSFCCPILADPPPPPQLTPPADPPTWLTDLPQLTDPPRLSQLTDPPPRAELADWLPLGVNKLTKWNYYLPVVLRTRAVKTEYTMYYFLPIAYAACQVMWTFAMSISMILHLVFPFFAKLQKSVCDKRIKIGQ